MSDTPGFKVSEFVVSDIASFRTNENAVFYDETNSRLWFTTHSTVTDIVYFFYSNDDGATWTEDTAKRLTNATGAFQSVNFEQVYGREDVFFVGLVSNAASFLAYNDGALTVGSPWTSTLFQNFGSGTYVGGAVAVPYSDGSAKIFFAVSSSFRLIPVSAAGVIGTATFLTGVNVNTSTQYMPLQFDPFGFALIWIDYANSSTSEYIRLDPDPAATVAISENRYYRSLGAQIQGHGTFNDYRLRSIYPARASTTYASGRVEQLVPLSLVDSNTAYLYRDVTAFQNTDVVPDGSSSSTTRPQIVNLPNSREMYYIFVDGNGPTMYVRSITEGTFFNIDFGLADDYFVYPYTPTVIAGNYANPNKIITVGPSAYGQGLMIAAVDSSSRARFIRLARPEAPTFVDYVNGAALDVNSPLTLNFSAFANVDADVHTYTVLERETIAGGVEYWDTLLQAWGPVRVENNATESIVLPAGWGTANEETVFRVQYGTAVSDGQFSDRLIVNGDVFSMNCLFYNYPNGVSDSSATTTRRFDGIGFRPVGVNQWFGETNLPNLNASDISSPMTGMQFGVWSANRGTSYAMASALLDGNATPYFYNDLHDGLVFIQPNATNPSQYGTDIHDHGLGYIDTIRGRGTNGLVSSSYSLYNAFGGYEVDVSTVVWGIDARNDSVGPKSITGVGFQPSLVLHFVLAQPTITDSATAMCFGAMNDVGEQFANYLTGAVADPSQLASGGTLARCIETRSAQVNNANPPVVFEASFLSMDSDGFSVTINSFNTTASTVQEYRVVSMCFSGVRTEIGGFVRQSGTGTTQTISGLSITPQYVTTYSSAAANQAVRRDLAWHQGFSDGATNQKSAAQFSLDASATSSGSLYLSDQYGFAIKNGVAGDQTDVSAATINNFQPGSFDVTWDINNATGTHVVHYIAWANDSNPPEQPTIDDPVAGDVRPIGSTLLVDWTFNDPDLGDTQTAYALQRVQGGTPEFWDATGGTWSSTEVKNTSAVEQVALPAFDWCDTLTTECFFSVKTWDSTDQSSPYSPSVRVVPASFINYYNGTAFALKPLYRYNGAQFVPSLLKRWDGAAWQPE